jgi:hypothetical protein
LKEQPMRVRASAIALGLGALAATPCLALTVQAAPPRPDIAQHLRSTTAPASSVLPGPDELKGSFVDSARPQLGSSSTSWTSSGTTSFNLGPIHATTTVSPGYGAFSGDGRRHDDENPLSLTPPRR